MDSEQYGRVGDLALMVVPRVGRLVGTGEGAEPYRLVDGDGAVMEAVGAYFRELQAAGRSAATVRSYGMDLLRWFRFLWAIGVAWDRATRVEARDFCPVDALPASRRARTGAGERRTRWLDSGRAYSASVRAHSETVLRGFYDFHLRRRRPAGQPVPAGPVAARRPGARAPQPDGAAPQRADRALPSAVPSRIPRSIPDERVQRDLRPAALAPGPGAGRVLRVHRGAGLGVAVGDAAAGSIRAGS